MHFMPFCYITIANTLQLSVDPKTVGKFPCVLTDSVRLKAQSAINGSSGNLWPSFCKADGISRFILL